MFGLSSPLNEERLPAYFGTCIIPNTHTLSIGQYFISRKVIKLIFFNLTPYKANPLFAQQFLLCRKSARSTLPAQSPVRPHHLIARVLFWVFVASYNSPYGTGRGLANSSQLFICCNLTLWYFLKQKNCFVHINIVSLSLKNRKKRPLTFFDKMI